MFDLFEIETNTLGGGMVFYDMRRLRMKLDEVVGRIRDYRAINPMGMPNGHPLIRLLMSIGVPLSLEPEFYVEAARDQTYRLSRALGFASTVSVGRVWTPGVFYGGGVSEIIMASGDAFDLTNIETTWPHLRPIRIISHPLTDLCMHVPDGIHNSPVDGSAVIEVNIAMLALQYRMWRKWERGRFTAESPRTVAQFLMAHPLPNAIYSQTDVAIFNRICYMQDGREITPVRSRHPFFVPDWAPSIDSVLRDYLTRIRNRNLDTHSIITSMPTVGYPSRYDTLALPNMPYSQQLLSAIVLARLSVVAFHLKTMVHENVMTDYTMLASLRRFINRIEGQNLVRRDYPPHLASQVQAVLDEQIKPYLPA